VPDATIIFVQFAFFLRASYPAFDFSSDLCKLEFMGQLLRSGGWPCLFGQDNQSETICSASPSSCSIGEFHE
jgi:hypothetical protein